jgi:hypothetical protein
MTPGFHSKTTQNIFGFQDEEIVDSTVQLDNLKLKK